MLPTQTHGLFWKPESIGSPHLPRNLYIFLAFSSHDRYSFFPLCFLQFKKFSSKIFITQSTDLNFRAKCYQHKHTAYYWRPGKHTISSSTQQFVHFSGTFKPWLLMLIFVKSSWKWIWLWTLKYGKGTHHKNTQQIACHVSPQTYYVPRRPHWPCSRRKSRRRKWGAATIEAWSSRWCPATTHDSPPLDPYLLISTKNQCRPLFLFFPAQNLTTEIWRRFPPNHDPNPPKSMSFWEI